MRQISLIFFLTLMLACKKEKKDPVCRFTKIGHGGSTKFPVTYYNGDTLVRVGEDYDSYTLRFDSQGRLIVREEPALDPYYHSEFRYNSFGQVTEQRGYSRQGNSWVYEDARLVFTYEEGRMINVREENAGSYIGNMYDHQVTWEGNNISAVVHRLNQQPVCTTKFSYDNAMPNPMRRFNDFYFCDGNANYTYYKLPFYFSEHLVTKQEGDCSLSETRLFKYTFTGSGLIESMSDRGYILWEYEYECK